MPTTPSSKYRPEIDGLRAFAVVAVIINHFNKDLLPSGYLGVDIFFVISGYVITSSLADRKSKNFLDFLTGFYERRIKRLVPALVVFVLITSVLISLFNPDSGSALKTGITSLFGFSNLYLFGQSTDYFAQSTELNPFTHTWSLGVEEQFYLLFPFLIWFSGFGQQTAKGARNLFFWVGAMTIASLLGFIYLYQVNQPAAYFLMPPRFWEMAAGCLLFIGFQKRARIEQALEQVPPLLVVAAMVGVMYLPVAAAVPATIGIVVLSAVLIACLKRGTVAYKFFTINEVVYIGLISYSLYLWHWAVLSISRWTIGIHWWSIPLQTIAILAMASISYRHIEVPVRRSSNPSVKFQFIGTGLIAIVISALTISLGVASLKKKMFLGDTKVDFFSHINELRQCDNLLDLNKVFQECKFVTQGGNRTIFFLGDSHNQALGAGMEYIAKKARMNYFIFGHIGNAFPVSTMLESNGSRVISIYRKTEREILLQAQRGDIVFLTNRYELIKDMTSYLKNLDSLATRLDETGTKLVISLPTPYFDQSIWGAACPAQWFNRFQGITCTIKRSEVEEIHFSIIADLKSLRERSNNVFLFDPLKALCSNNDCDYSINGNALYTDGNHLSEYAIKRMVSPSIALFLQENVISRAK